MVKTEEQTESEVSLKLREYLELKGRHIEKLEKKKGEHGCDIIARHRKWRKSLFIEVKGSGKAALQMKHNGFYMLLGQILSRMDIGGNDPKKARTYALAIPADREKTFRNKIKTMAYGRKLLKLRVYLVHKDGSVVEKSYSKFLKELEK